MACLWPAYGRRFKKVYRPRLFSFQGTVNGYKIHLAAIFLTVPPVKIILATMLGLFLIDFSTWYQVLGTKCLVPSTWYQVLGAKYLVPSIWYRGLRTTNYH